MNASLLRSHLHTNKPIPLLIVLKDTTFIVLRQPIISSDSHQVYVNQSTEQFDKILLVDFA
jgi:hypothetical protein